MYNMCKYKYINLFLTATIIVFKLNLGLAVYTHLLTELGSYMDASCSNQKCDRNVNEQLIQITESYMNTNADPCEDFFDYACGNWKNISDIHSTFEKQEEDFNLLLVDIMQKLQLQLEENNYGPKINEAFKKALHYYNSCLQIDDDDFDLSKFLALIEPAAAQKWPIYKNRTSLPWNFENFVWWKVLAKLQSFNFKGTLIEVDIDCKDLSCDFYTINIMEPDTSKELDLNFNVLSAMGNYTILQQELLQRKLGTFAKKLTQLLEQSNVEEEETSPAVRNITIKEMLENAGAEFKDLMNNLFDKDVPEENRMEILINLFEAKRDTANNNISESNEVIWEKVKEFKPSAVEGEQYLSLNDLQTKLPDIDWQQYFHILLHGAPISLNAKIFTITNIKILQQLISYFNKTSKETLALYMLANFLEYLEENLPVSNKNTNCIATLVKLMPLNVAYLYEEYHYGAIRNESDFVINDILLRLKKKLNELFEDSDLDLSLIEIEYLKLKVEKMTLNIGNLPVDMSVEFLMEHYATVNITNATNFYHNHLELLRNQVLLLYRIINAEQSNSTNVYNTFDALGWSASISPYFQFSLNRIVLPFSYLRMPLYHHKMHDVFLFSELGWSLGHEIMHGFDTTGLMYDADGNYVTFAQKIIDKKSFSKKIDCFLEQETASLDERIADISGLHLVIKTFLNDRTGKTSKFLTHSTALSNRQLFFVKLSHFFCDRFNYDGTDLTTLDHDLPEVRVVYSMQNTREFTHEFKCQQKSAMKTNHKCSLW